MRNASRAVLLLVLAATARAAEGVAQQARASVHEVLARPEFQPLADADRLPRLPRPEMNWLPSFLRALARSFADLFGGILSALGKVLGSVFKALRSLFSGLSGAGAAEGASVLGTFVLWAVVVAAVFVLVWLLVRLSRATRADSRAGARALAVADAGGGEDDALARSPEDWRRRAERLAAGGDCGEALRALYLELLAGLHRAGAIYYDHSRTNTAYVFDLARAHPARPPFLSLTRRFDSAVYGAHEPGADGLRRAIDEADMVRAALVREATDG